MLSIEKSLGRWQSVWPFLRTVDNAKNPDRCFIKCMRRDVGRAVNYQFSGASDSAYTAARWKIYQPTDGSNDPFVDQNGG